MSNKQDIWTLFTKHEGRWLSRAELDIVGGHEATRRIRELREGSLSQGYSIEQRENPQTRRPEYRMVRVAIEQLTDEAGWACMKCSFRPATGTLQPSTDSRDRWRLGHCRGCSNYLATFKRRES